MKSLRSGFTLIELLVVIGIVSLLLALTFPAVQMARESARIMRCKDNLRQVSLAFVNFETSHCHFPPGYLGVVQDETAYLGTFRREGSLAGHLLYILPFLEQSSFADRLGSQDPSPFV